MINSINDLQPASYNPRKISREAKALLEKSLRLFGDLSGITINRRTGNLVCGHQRTSVLKQLTSQPIQWGEPFSVELDGKTSTERLGVVEVDGKRFMVREVDWSSGKEKSANVIANDQRNQGTFDVNLLPLVLEDIRKEDEELFANLSLGELLGEPATNGKTDADDVPETPTIAKSQEGQIYTLGNHRLMCASSTDPQNLKKLLGDEQADLWITDPPYNVAYVGKTKDALTIANDSMEDEQFLQFLTDAYGAADSVMRPGAVGYIWHADSEGYNFRLACRNVNWKLRQCLIWKKNVMVMGRQDYHWKHEPCLYFFKDGAAHYWGSDRCQTTILEFDRPSRSTDHPTTKPVNLFAYQINNSSKPNDIVLDSFMGSGTTILACEQTGRRARGLELSPTYCDVIRRRWAEFVHGEGCDWEKLTPAQQ